MFKVILSLFGFAIIIGVLGSGMLNVMGDTTDINAQNFTSQVSITPTTPKPKIYDKHNLLSLSTPKPKKSYKITITPKPNRPTLLSLSTPKPKKSYKITIPKRKPIGNNIAENHQDNMDYFVEIRDDIKETGEIMAHGLDLAGKVIAYTFVDRLIYEVDYLETHIELYESRIERLAERLKNGKYHTDKCEYQNPDWVSNPRICREHASYLLHKNWKFGKPMTKEQMQQKIRDHQAEILKSEQRIMQAKIEAVELDKEIKNGLRHEGTEKQIQDMEKIIQESEDAKARGVAMGNSTTQGLLDIDKKRNK